jgi:putative DNA primase/helicase
LSDPTAVNGTPEAPPATTKKQVDGGATRPVAIKPNLAGMPEELRALPQWVLWWFTRKEGKWTKVPYVPGTTGKASTTDPSTWRSFDYTVQQVSIGQCVQNRKPDGIGFVFSESDPFCGIDLDDSRDPVTGEIREWARPLVEMLDSFTDVSPSGTGLKIITRACLTGTGKKKRYGDGAVEVYDRGRYFTLTGVAP